MTSKVKNTEENEEEISNFQKTLRTHHYNNSMEEITTLVKARIPIIWVITHDELRFIETFYSESQRLKKKLYTYSLNEGIKEYQGSLTIDRCTGQFANTMLPHKALDAIMDLNHPIDLDNKGSCFILKDFHSALKEPIPRQLRDIYPHLISQSKTLIVVSPALSSSPDAKSGGLPLVLEKYVSVVDFDYLTQDQIVSQLKAAAAQLKMSNLKRNRHVGSDKKQNSLYKVDYSEEEYVDFSKTLSGLTFYEIENAIATSLHHMKEISIDKLILEKQKLIKRSEILEFIPSNIDVADVGGLDLAKDYIVRYKDAFSDEAVKYGVEPLKGLILTGVPGTGKSLLAKTIGNIWKAPLIKLDIGKVMTGLVGGSEGKMRDVIRQAEAMSPCVLWLDEVEKGLAGTKSSNFSDGGTLARVFGTLLTAMQDGLDGVTIIATANDITLLPPEFIRRFNEVFFVDLPTDDERWEILEIHLRKRDRNISNFDKDKKKILQATDGFTGAELEKAVKDAITTAFYSKQKDLTSKELLHAINDTKPISKVMKDKIDKIRSVAKNNYRYASSKSEAFANTVLTKSGKKLNLDETLNDLSEIQTSKEKQENLNENGDRFSNLD